MSYTKDEQLTVEEDGIGLCSSESSQTEQCSPNGNTLKKHKEELNHESNNSSQTVAENLCPHVEEGLTHKNRKLMVKEFILRGHLHLMDTIGGSGDMVGSACT